MRHRQPHSAYRVTHGGKTPAEVRKEDREKSLAAARKLEDAVFAAIGEVRCCLSAPHVLGPSDKLAPAPILPCRRPTTARTRRSAIINVTKKPQLTVSSFRTTRVRAADHAWPASQQDATSTAAQIRTFTPQRAVQELTVSPVLA